MDFWFSVMIGSVQLSLLAIIFMLFQLLKFLKIINITTIETAKQINIIDRNTYPKQSSKKFQ